MGIAVPGTAPMLQTFLFQNFHIEACGDDTRVFALTDLASSVLGDGPEDTMAVWKEHLPWAMKAEGWAVFDGTFVENMLRCPPMVSRRMVPIFVGSRWYLFEPLTDVARFMSTLVHSCGEAVEYKETLYSVSTNIALLWHAWRTGYLVDPGVECFHRTWVSGDDDLRRHLLTVLSYLFSSNLPLVTPLESQEVWDLLK